jgi:hypothetical protein
VHSITQISSSSSSSLSSVSHQQSQCITHIQSTAPIYYRNLTDLLFAWHHQRCHHTGMSNYQRKDIYQLASNDVTYSLNKSINMIRRRIDISYCFVGAVRVHFVVIHNIITIMRLYVKISLNWWQLKVPSFVGRWGWIDSYVNT